MDGGGEAGSKTRPDQTEQHVVQMVLSQREEEVLLLASLPSSPPGGNINSSSELLTHRRAPDEIQSLYPPTPPTKLL